MPHISTDVNLVRLDAAFAALMHDARQQRATDIHLDPADTGVMIRYRVDGALREVASPGNLDGGRLIQLAKSLCKLNCASNLPQHGNGRIIHAGGRMDFSIASFPTDHGERLTLHLQPDPVDSLSLDQLRLAPAECIQLQQLTDAPQGVIIAAGPPSPTKIALLYALLNHIDRANRSVMTMEDPIFAPLAGVCQTAVGASGLSWNRLLSRTLEQDPDVVALGTPPRHSALQRIFSATHEHRLFLLQLTTPSGAHTLRHLLDSGLQPFQLADGLQAIIAQRAIRVLCPECKAPGTPNLALYGPQIAEFLATLSHSSFFLPVGCARCRHTGYESVLPMLEILPMTTALSDLLATNPSLARLRKATAIEGLPPLLHNALLKASIGLIALDEVRRVLPPGTL